MIRSTSRQRAPILWIPALAAHMKARPWTPKRQMRKEMSPWAMGTSKKIKIGRMEAGVVSYGEDIRSISFKSI